MAPVLTDYMGRMYLAGYGEGYRRNILYHAFRILDQKEKKISDGTGPRCRKKEFEAEKRRIEKKNKKRTGQINGNMLHQ